MTDTVREPHQLRAPRGALQVRERPNRGPRHDRLDRRPFDEGEQGADGAGVGRPTGPRRSSATGSPRASRRSPDVVSSTKVTLAMIEQAMTEQ
ncbi:hypothetical protein GLX30_14480 [Streptomyces sp. Tu 2975]|uniref:hypothetical protein n=1 Tax=Streptomyces sp. Tu 2975 TaxID=2676871 RepID=UPI001356B7AD|nr:hypothetical protein [Streptomyces sp. Tu 2975]QIP85030.1 hypothetical protein GLX30_14480 [Streptomyces sp. Tu 2975]